VIGGLSQIAFFVGVLSRAPGISPLFVLAGLVAGLVYWRIVEKDPDNSGVSAAGSRSPD
jgi:hypothetical protein